VSREACLQTEEAQGEFGVHADADADAEAHLRGSSSSGTPLNRDGHGVSGGGDMDTWTRPPVSKNSRHNNHCGGP
jgi:hypothetical protein